MPTARGCACTRLLHCCCCYCCCSRRTAAAARQASTSPPLPPLSACCRTRPWCAQRRSGQLAGPGTPLPRPVGEPGVLVPTESQCCGSTGRLAGGKEAEDRCQWQMLPGLAAPGATVNKRHFWGRKLASHALKSMCSGQSRLVHASKHTDPGLHPPSAAIDAPVCSPLLPTRARGALSQQFGCLVA